MLNTAAKLSPAQIGKKQEIRGSRTRISGLDDIIVRLGGSPLAGEASRRDSLDNILNKFGKGDKSERRKGSVDDKEDKKKEEEEGGRNRGSLKRIRGETAFKSKRMRTNAGNSFRRDITVNKKSKILIPNQLLMRRWRRRREVVGFSQSFLPTQLDTLPTFCLTWTRTSLSLTGLHQVLEFISQFRICPNIPP